MKYKVGDNVVLVEADDNKRYAGLTGKVIDVVGEEGVMYPYLVEVGKRHVEFIKRWPEKTIYCSEGHIDSNDILATKWIRRHEV